MHLMPGGSMKSPQALSTLALIGLISLAGAQGKSPMSYPVMAPVEQYRSLNVQEEIALARSAAPASISAGAEILVLGKRGYETAVSGSNGFVCFVERSWTAGFDDPEFWNPEIRGPNCFNSAAVRSVLPQYLRRTEWVLAGVAKGQMIEKARAALAAHQFTDPEAGSFSFMLSKQGNLGDQAAGGPWLPHVMFFVKHGETAAWAAGLEGSPILGKDGLPSEPTVLFIPVRRWSDGSPAPPPPTEHHHGE
jgi:hypothetical protein